MDRQTFIAEFSRHLVQGSGALFVGAGLSLAAGYPDWRTLLGGIATELGIDLQSEHDLPGIAQWHINQSSKNRTRIAQLIKQSFPDKTDVPEPLRILARLPLRHVWTTNYDKLIERAWELQGRRLDVKAINSDLSVPSEWADTTLYKMHGTVDHPGEVVIATDDYELFRRTRSGFLHVLSGHLIGMHCLFLGFSFTDPNIAHLLAIIRESMSDHPATHYAIVRRPATKGNSKKATYERSRHSHWISDLQRYGIQCVAVDDHSEIADILRDIETSIARQSVFVSGSFPSDPSRERDNLEQVAEKVGDEIAGRKLRLISGFGSTIGSAVVAGAISRLFQDGTPSLDRSLLLRPFPQTVPQGFDSDRFYRRYREDMIRQAGICIFIGGTRKTPNGMLEVSQGVIDEFKIAREFARVIIPVAATGGAAHEIWKMLDRDGGAKAAGLTQPVFKRLGKTDVPVAETVAAIRAALAGVQKSK